MNNFLYLFLRMVARQCYGRRKRNLELGMYRWTTSNARIRQLCGVTEGADEGLMVVRLYGENGEG